MGEHDPDPDLRRDRDRRHRLDPRRLRRRADRRHRRHARPRLPAELLRVCRRRCRRRWAGLASMAIYILMAAVLFCAAAAACSRRAADAMHGPCATARRALVVAGAARCSLRCAAAGDRAARRRAVLHRRCSRRILIFAHRRRQPRPDPRLWRHGQLRPRRLLRHRRLCRRHPRLACATASRCWLRPVRATPGRLAAGVLVGALVAARHRRDLRCAPAASTSS